MPRIDKALRRDSKINKRKYGHQVDGRSIFILQEIAQKKAEKIKAQREKEKRKAEEIYEETN